MKWALLPSKDVFWSKAKGYDDLVGYGMEIGPGMIVNCDAGLMISWRIKGRDLESSSTRELVRQSEQINNVIRRLPVGWMLHIDSVRRPAIGYPSDSRFPDRTSWLIDEERRADYERSNAHYVSEEVLTATYLCPRDTTRVLWAWLSSRDGRKGKGDFDRAVVAEAEREFLRGVETISRGFQEELSPRRMVPFKTIHPTEGEWIEDPQLRHLIFCATGNDIPVRQPPLKTDLRGLVASQHLRNGDRLHIGDKVVGVLTVEDVPNRSFPGILDILNQQPCSYRVSHRYIVMDRQSAQKEIELARRKHFQGRKGLLQQIAGGEPVHMDGDALTMAHDAGLASDEVRSGDVVFGYWTMAIVFYETVEPGESEEAAETRLAMTIKNVTKPINELGFVARDEDTNTLDAFLGTLPGHGQANVRRAMLSSRDLADFLPTTSLWTGERYCPSPMYPPKSPPLAVVSSTGTMPYYFNLHVGDVGHTMVVGPTGAGKSTLLAFLLAQHRRYPGARQIAIDLGYSLYTLCQGVGGAHHVVSASGTPTFAPLEHIDRPAERAWAESWVALLLQLQKVEVTSTRRGAIALALESLASAPKRSLTALTLQPFLDEETRRALRYYTIEHEGAGLMDAEHTQIADNRFTVFEMEALRELGKEMLVPALTYIFHLIEGWLKDATPTVLALDEVWSMLDDAQQAEQIRTWLKTLRKKNTAVIFATQSLEDLIQSPIRATLLQSCPTKIFLANPDASSPEGLEAYKACGLTDWEITSGIARGTPKLTYYIVQPLGRRLISLDLQRPSLAFLGVSGGDVARVQALIEQDQRNMASTGKSGSWWPAQWLRIRANERWARYWVEGPSYARRAPIPPPPAKPAQALEGENDAA